MWLVSLTKLQGFSYSFIHFFFLNYDTDVLGLCCACIVLSLLLYVLYFKPPPAVIQIALDINKST